MTTSDNILTLTLHVLYFWLKEAEKKRSIKAYAIKGDLHKALSLYRNLDKLAVS